MLNFFFTFNRKRMGEFFMQVCEFHSLPMPRNKLFRNMELIDFLYKPVSYHSNCQLFKNWVVQLVFV